MKNRKRFQKFMLSAVALTTLIPFTSSAGIVQARWNKPWHTRYGLNQINIRAAYGELNAKHNNGKIAIHEGSKNGNKLSAWAAEGSTTSSKSKKKIPNTTGFLVENKGLSGQPFGAAAKNWSRSDEGDPKNIKKGDHHYWYIYTFPNGDYSKNHGQIGMFYKNALTYYPNKNGKKVKLNARIVWNGDYHYQYNKKTMPNLNIHFDSKHLAVKEPYGGEGNFSLLLTRADNDQPFAVKSELTQTDVDAEQGLIFNAPNYILVSKNTKLNAGVQTSWAGTGIQNGVARIFGDYAEVLTDKKTGKNLRQGTVWKYDPDGRFSYIPKKSSSEYNVTFVHDYDNEAYEAPKLGSWAKPASINFLNKHKIAVGKIKHVAAHKDTKGNYTDHAQADYFGFDFDKGTIVPYDIPVDKWVSKTKNNFTKHSTKETINDTGTAYFDIHTSLKAPSSALVKSGNTDENYNALPLAAAINDKDDPYMVGVKKSKHAKQQLVLTDYVDPSLKVVNAKVYESEWDDKYGRKLKPATKAFTLQYDKQGLNKHKGYTVVEAKMTDKAAEATSDAWHKNYHLVIQVKPKPDQQPAEGSIYSGSTVVNNQAWLNGKDSGAKSKLIVKYNHTDTTTKGDSKNGLTAHKYVYAADPKDPTKAKDTGAADIHEQTVYPNQYLYYRLRFKLNNFTQVEKKDGHKLTSSDGQKLVDDKYTDFTIHDTLDDKFRTKLDSSGDAAVDHVQVSLDPKDFNNNSATHGATINGNKLSIKINKDSGKDKDKDKTMLKELSKNGGTIWVQYRVQIRPNEVGANANKYLKPLNLHYEDNVYLIGQFIIMNLLN
ncbi:hypothetical protein [Lactobacillus sp. PV012]|uniref:hypothetical protein n=1 Tax=Lactobacillus sp. PV012 TaxID=2594494 RepID=UPI00223F64FD|nr:hypothetical protein [Lactobacillus sp. PV012]QNQ82239.1 hypothetical protein FP433_03895 [Lactobacillus sp. PV012]